MVMLSGPDFCKCAMDGLALIFIERVMCRARLASSSSCLTIRICIIAHIDYNKKVALAVTHASLLKIYNAMYFLYLFSTLTCVRF